MFCFSEIECVVHAEGSVLSHEHQLAVRLEAQCTDSTETIFLHYKSGGCTEPVFELSMNNCAAPAQITALYMVNDWWTRPAFIHSYSKIPERTQVMLVRTEDTCYCVLALTGENYKAQIVPGTESCFYVRMFSNTGSTGDFSEPVFIVSRHDSPRTAAETAMKTMAKLHGLPLREQRAYPEMLKYLGWCSWDAFYQDVNAEGLKEKAKELAEKNIPVKWFLIDDGWLSTEGKKLTGYEPDESKFPNGFAPVIADIRETARVDWFGVWHAVCGYWEGLADQNSCDCDEYLYRTKDGGLYPSPYNGETFYRKWYEYLKKEGISFVKVDGQSSVASFFKDNIPVSAAARGIAEAFEGASEIMDYSVINCMGMAMESIAARKLTGISRNSDDFVPARGTAGFREHLLQNAYNSLYHNVLYICDWDMFWSKEADAPKHGVLRSFSGGPAYFSDRVGETVSDVFRPMTYTAGGLPMMERSLLPADDCVFTDPLESGCLKLHNFGKQAGRNAGAMILFNLTEDTQDWEFTPGDIGELDSTQKYIVYDWFAKKILPENSVYKGSLEPDKFSLNLILPEGKHMAALGRTDLYAGFTAVKTWEEQDKLDRIVLKESGPFSWVSKYKPLRVSVNNNDMTSSVVQDGQLYHLPLSVNGESAEIVIEWQ